MLRAVATGLAISALLILTTFGWRGWFEKAQPVPENELFPQRLKEHVIKLSEDIGDRSVFKFAELEEAATYITDAFTGMGFTVENQEYLLHGKTVRNIIARKKGTARRDEIIVLGAHYDTCFNPGANDNASGVAGLLELARMLVNEQHERTIEFVAFVNEEPPFFRTESMGSYVYAREAREKEKDIRAAVILEMIGYYSNRPFSQRYPLLLGPLYPHRANFIAFVGNISNRHLVNDMQRSFSRHSDFPAKRIVLFDFVPGVDFSDHWSFWQHGFPAIMVTDTAFYRYEHYHEKTDTFEKLDYQSMAAVVEGLAISLNELAGRRDPS